MMSGKSMNKIIDLNSYKEEKEKQKEQSEREESLKLKIYNRMKLLSLIEKILEDEEANITFLVKGKDIGHLISIQNPDAKQNPDDNYFISTIDNDFSLSEGYVVSQLRDLEVPVWKLLSALEYNFMED